MCFVQTLQVVKVNRCLESNEDSINAQPEGKTKFLFCNFIAAGSENCEKNFENCEIFRETEAKQLQLELPHPERVRSNLSQDC